MSLEFRIDIDGTVRCAEKLDDLKRCARQIVWRIDDVKDLATDERHKLVRCMHQAEQLTRYFGGLYELLLDISDDAYRTEQKIEMLMDEYLRSGARFMD